MKFHSIFYKPYQVWWLVLAIICFIKFFIFGLPNTSNGKYGYVFHILGTLLSGLLYGSVFYLIYRLISKKWDNKVYIVLISLATVLDLIIRNK